MGTIGAPSVGSMKDNFKHYILDGFIEGVTVLDYSIKGNIGYCVIRREEDETNIIFVAKMERRRDGMFYYKTMDETVGPIYYDVPQRLMKIAEKTPIDSEYAKEYRRKVWEHHRLKKERRKQHKQIGTATTSIGVLSVHERRTVNGQAMMLAKIPRKKAGWVIMTDDNSPTLVVQMRFHTPEQAWEAVNPPA